MNKKKFVSVGIFAVVVAIGAGVAYYCYPSVINNALGINSAGVDTISDGDLLAVDSASSSLAAIDPDAGTDDAAADAGAEASQVRVPAKPPSSAKKSVATIQSGAASVPAAEGSLDNGTMAATSSSSSSSVASSTTATLPATPCVFPTSAPAPSTTREIIFNEIAWMGSPLSSTAEWMEIKNISAAAVDLSGWELFDAAGKIKISFTGSDGALAPGGLLLLSRGTTTPAGAIGATKTYSGDLVNTGDSLALMDPQCIVSDYLDSSGGWPAGNNTTKQTLERDADGIGWHTSAQPGGTPGAENSAALAATTTASIEPSLAPPSVQIPTPVQTPQSQNVAPIENTPEDTSPSSDSNVTASTSVATLDAQSTTTTSTASGDDNGNNNSNSVDNSAPTTTTAAASASSHVLIAAVQIAGASSSNDLLRLYNPTAAAIDMSGWKLHKKSSTGTDYSLKVFPAGSVIGAGQLFVWANSSDGFSETVSANVSSTETLAADNSVALMDAAGTIVDAVAWGTGASQYGEGPPYPTSPGANQLLSRRSSDGVMADTDDNNNDFALQ
jgi:hypothetical protein